MSERVLLKLGGSVITHKGGSCNPDVPRLKEIAGVIASRKQSGLILVHGAGSCGHPEARAYRLDRGIDDTNLEGIYRTHAAVRSLNDGVVSTLRLKGVEAIGLHLLCAATARGGRLLSLDTAPYGRMLDLGITPVLHGDVVMDLEQGASIVSGDQILRYLAIGLGIRRVGVATDVPGVLFEGRVLERLDEQTAGRIGIGTSSHPDVTGGMRGKVRELCELARAGVESHIFDASRIGDFLDGNDHGGTTICRGG